MSRASFLLKLQLAERLLTPTASVDSGQLDADWFRERISSADLWLRPEVVADFVAADFSELSEAERAELDREVQAFRAIASQVPGDAPATTTQSNQARTHLVRILEILEPVLEPRT